MEIPNPEGQGRLVAQVISKGLCVGCGACVGLCPYFNYFDGKIVVLDPCSAGTFRCLQMCPRADYDKTSPARGEITDPIGKCIDICMARAADETVRIKSQYGGVVSAILIYALEKGIISAAVMTDRGNPFAPKGRIVNNRAEILDCAGSRYSASGSLSALNTAIGKGRSRLGVVGLPCQMEALERMRLMQPDGSKRAEAVSIRIGLFCTWAIDYRQLESYLSRHNVELPVVTSDIPPPPAETYRVLSQSGWRDFPLSDIRRMVLKGCSLCEDMTAEHSDISVGTAEGRHGWNTVITRTEAGSRLLDNAIEEGWLETAPPPQGNLDHLKEAARNKRERARKQKLTNQDITGEA